MELKNPWRKRESKRTKVFVLEELCGWQVQKSAKTNARTKVCKYPRAGDVGSNFGEEVTKPDWDKPSYR
jgi:hypothetical protein